MLVAIRASEALFVPRIAFVRDSTAFDYLSTFVALLSVRLFITGNATDCIIPRNKALATDGDLALHAKKALLMPLLAAVFVLAHARLEHILAAIASTGEALIVTV